MDPVAVAPVLPDLPTAWELSGRLLLAAFLGAIIGLERELRDHPSGLRTHISVALGAALFGIVSAYAFTEFIAVRAGNNYQVDVTRVAAQVVTGIGFLGGGAIIKQGNTVRGLTSAAGLWVSAAVGLAVSLGLYIEATVATILLVLSLSLKRPLKWLRIRYADIKATLVIEIALDTDSSWVITALGTLPDTLIRSLVVKRHEDEGFTAIEVEIESKHGMLQNRLATIEGWPDVHSVTQM